MATPSIFPIQAYATIAMRIAEYQLCKGPAIRDKVRAAGQESLIRHLDPGMPVTSSMADAIAVMAFRPDGITVLGETFKALLT